MKVLFILSIFTIVFCTAFLDPDQVDQYAIDCIKEHEAYSGSVESTMKNLTQDQENCIYACMDKKKGLMKQNGSYNIKQLLVGIINPKLKKALRKLLVCINKACKPKAGNDSCKMAGCFHRTIRPPPPII